MQTYQRCSSYQYSLKSELFVDKLHDDLQYNWCLNQYPGIKLASNQIDNTVNNIVDLEKKTATMDLGFIDRIKGVRQDNKQLVSNIMKKEAKNYFETQQLTTELVEKIRNHPKFARNFDDDTITNLQLGKLDQVKGSLQKT